MSIRRMVSVVALALGLVLALASPGQADEPGESDQARVLVQQAIALIVNTPGDVMAIEERVGDAIEAPHQDGVEPALVRRAASAVSGGDLDKARQLLQTAIGAGPFVGAGLPEPVGEAQGEPGRPAYAVGAQTGTTVVLDALEPARRLRGGEWTLLVLSAAVAAAGGWLSWRWRPRDTVHSLARVPRQPRGKEA